MSQQIQSTSIPDAELKTFCALLVHNFESLFAFQVTEANKADDNNDFSAFLAQLQIHHKALHDHWMSLKKRLFETCEQLDGKGEANSPIPNAKTLLFRGLYGFDSPEMPVQNSGIAQGHHDLDLLSLFQYHPIFAIIFSDNIDTLNEINAQFHLFKQNLFASKLLAFLTKTSGLFTDTAHPSSIQHILNIQTFATPRQVRGCYASILYPVYETASWRTTFTEMIEIALAEKKSKTDQLKEINALLASNVELNNYLKNPIHWQILSDMPLQIETDLANIKANFNRATAFIHRVTVEKALEIFEHVAGPIATKARNERHKHKEAAIKKLEQKFDALCEKNPKALEIAQEIAATGATTSELDKETSCKVTKIIAIDANVSAVEQDLAYRTRWREEHYYNVIQAGLAELKDDAQARKNFVINLFTHNPLLMAQINSSNATPDRSPKKTKPPAWDPRVLKENSPARKRTTQPVNPTPSAENKGPL